MKLIKPSIKLIEQEPGKEGILKQIELAARTSYKSYNKITNDSYKKFIDMLIERGHLSPLEHGSVYLKIPIKAETSYRIDEYKDNPYTKTAIDKDLKYYYISTNYRVLVEHDWLDDLKYLCEPTEYHEKRITIKVICSIGTSRELNRHRTLSIVEQSTRFCNFSADKFDNEITYILPPWIGETDVRNFYENSKGDNFLKYNKDSLGGSFIFLFNLEELEEAYIALVKEEGWKPQQAREVLPLNTATEVVYTAFLEDWKHFLSLRSPKYEAKGVHPNAAVIGDMIYEEFIKRGY